MIISDESPLRRIPDGLDQRQACFLDGIRLSVEMSDASYTRLSNRLWEIAISFAGGERVRGLEMAHLLEDAWSIVDSIHRLRALLDAMPRLKKNTPLYQSFTRATEPATVLRNTVQHLREELHEMAEKGWPVWGVLSWLALVKGDGTLVRSCVANAGRMQTGSHQLLNPAGRLMTARVDHVTLESKEVRVSLSEFLRQAERVIRPIERSLGSQFPDCSTCGSGFVVCADIAYPLDAVAAAQLEEEGGSTPSEAAPVARP